MPYIIRDLDLDLDLRIRIVMASAYCMLTRQGLHPRAVTPRAPGAARRACGAHRRGDGISAIPLTVQCVTATSAQ